MLAGDVRLDVRRRDARRGQALSMDFLLNVLSIIWIYSDVVLLVEKSLAAFNPGINTGRRIQRGKRIGVSSLPKNFA